MVWKGQGVVKILRVLRARLPTQAPPLLKVLDSPLYSHPEGGNEASCKMLSLITSLAYYKDWTEFN